MNFITHQNMKVYGRVEVSSGILNLGIRQRRVVEFALPIVLPFGNSFWYLQNTRLGDPQRRCGRFGEEKNVSTWLENELYRPRNNYTD